jgi:effector-binding domain-containing protein
MVCLFIFIFFSTMHVMGQVEVTEGTPFCYIYMEFQGSYDQIPQGVGQLYQEAAKQNHQSLFSHASFGIFFDSFLRGEEADTVWGLGFRAPEDIQVKPPFKKAKFQYDTVATMIYVGAYESIGMAFNTIVPYIEEHNLKIVGPPVEIWMDDPNQVEPQDCRTKVIIPVKAAQK